ncbi:MAG: hypothetical protein KJ736_01200 [Candidatus Omnitrophica bacterium]|nr:hypothetical protein [Candidatus Omnitrophota bacterium]
MNIDGNKCIEDVLSQGKEGSERKTKRLYFVEDYAPFIHDLDGTIIALNPMTCAMLDEEKIEYQVIEDFYDASERVKYGDEYHERLSAWITKFDQYLNSKVENSIDKQIEFLRAHGYFVKNYVDSLLVNVFNYVSILDALNPSEVVVVSKRKPEIALMSGIKKWIFNVDPSVLKIVCEKRGVPFCYEMVAKETSDVPKISSKNLLNKVRLFIKNNKRGVELFLLRILFFPKRMKRKKEGVFKKFLLVNDDWLIDFYKNAIIAGYDVAYFSEKGPRKFPAKVPEDESLSMDEEKRVVQWKRVAKDCFREFNPSLWVNVEAGLDISQIFDRCIQYFLETVCPQISKYVQEYTIYFDKFGITHAICDIKVTPAAVGVMFAAFLKENVVAAQIEHGETTGEDHVFLYSERPVDLYISCSKDQESFFKEFLNNDSRKKIEVVAGDVWNKRYKKYFDIIADKKI